MDGRWLQPEDIVRAPGTTWQDLLDGDSREVPSSFREQSPYLGPVHDIHVDRYITREFHELEKKYLWSRVWQFACREEHIPEIGSYIIYDIADQSYLVVRTATDEIKAYPNACLHRGRLLKTYDGRCNEFRCPFHGFTWHLDGELKQVPAEWDFPQLENREGGLSLPEVCVGTWGGFVFINPNPDAESLMDFLGVLPQHFERWDFENRYVSAHVARVINCNWKVAQEAFSEGYHVNATHPHVNVYSADPQSQVDVWNNVGRYIGIKGLPSSFLRWSPTEEEILRAAIDVREDEELPFTLKDGDTARSILAKNGRERFRATFGDRVDDLTDAEFLEAFMYVVFPNFHPWGAFNRIVYRFRPNGDDHETCIFDLIYVAPFTGERPPPAEIHWLTPDQQWGDAPELDKLSQVSEQDTFNMEHVQKGMKVLRNPFIIPSRYQEAMVRWRHDLIDQYIDRGRVET
jgi:phenylpropionate dioxygenase-like ring-hydroxylating dioxygenase large terminal subunit